MADGGWADGLGRFVGDRRCSRFYLEHGIVRHSLYFFGYDYYYFII